MPTDPTFWIQLVEGLTPGAKLILTGMILFFYLGRRALKILDNKLNETKEQATLAAVRSEPTGNGFAKSVQDKLDILVSKSEKAEKDIQKLKKFARDRHPLDADELDSEKIK